MAKMIQFEGRGNGCQHCEEHLTDWLDGTLDAVEQVRFDQHIASCATCSERAGEAQRGAAWLEMLRTPRPEPTAALLERILAQTSAAGMPGFESDDQTREWPGYGVPASAVPTSWGIPAHAATVGAPTNVIPFGSRLSSFGTHVMAKLAANQKLQTLRYNLLQPRLAMTAAMAFFSLALTLNLMGVRLNEVKASNLTPSGLERTYYDTTARAARYYGNLKVVYVMESKLEDIRRSHQDDTDAIHPDGGSDRGNAPADGGPAPQQDQAPDQQQEKRKVPGPGTSRRMTPEVQAKPHLVPVSNDVTSRGNRSREIAELQPVAAAKHEFYSAGGDE